jgi:hypothetical protein
MLLAAVSKYVNSSNFPSITALRGASNRVFFKKQKSKKKMYSIGLTERTSRDFIAVR